MTAALPCYVGQSLTEYGAAVAGYVVAQVSVALIIVGFIACFVGAWCGRASWYFLHVFVLRRSPRWRRFQRALSRVFA